jgi:uncharacterized protein YneF (UPF0154 family)
MQKLSLMSKFSINQSNTPIKPIAIPSWILFTQCICFAILYGIWAVPETILVRNICLIMGALLGLYVMVRNRHIFITKQVLPIGMLCLLFMWVFFQLIYLGTNPSLQFEEFSSIWKRTIIGFIFAVGFGLALASRSQGLAQDEKQGRNRIFWGLIYFGFMLPTLIYLLKYVLTFEAPKFGLISPDYLKLHYRPLPFYMPKTVYVAFCLPLFAISLGQIAIQLNRPKWQPLLMILYVVSCAAVLFIFYAENIKNGVAYSIILTIIFYVMVLFKYRARIRAKDILFALVFFIALGFFVHHHINKNKSYAALIADIQVAVQLDRFEQWKFSGKQGYPINALGKKVSATYYERIAWGVAGAQLLLKNPLGYGLIERSFGHLAKEKWPESKLHQSHSGWLDLALGLGFPGIVLILGSLTIVLLRCAQSSDSLAYFGFWLLVSLGLLWCTTEVSQKVYFDWLIFAIAWVGALSMSIKQVKVSLTNLKSTDQ